MTLEGLQVALLIPSSALDSLEDGLHALAFVPPPLRRVELRTAEGAEEVLALLGFDDARSYTVHRGHLATLATLVSGQVFDLANLEGEALAGFEQLAQRLDVRASSRGDARQAFAELRHHGQATLRLTFESTHELLLAWARQVSEGALWVPTSRPVTAPRLKVTFATPDGEYVDNPAVRSAREGGGGPGLWLEVSAGPALGALLQQVATERRASRPPRPAPRVVERTEADLLFRVEAVEGLARLLEGELRQGRLFVPTAAPPPLRTRARVLLTLPDEDVLVLQGEVVHRVADGPLAGVGLQLLELRADTFAPVEALLAQHQRRPRVLVVDDEAIWRSTLTRVFTSLGAEVVEARDGHEGLLELIDGYFELDLVMLDLHMPNLDGRGLIERVRRLGGDAHLKLFLFSAAPREELQALGAPGLATRVFSKLDPLDRLARELAHELGRSWPPPQRAAA